MAVKYVVPLFAAIVMPMPVQNKLSMLHFFQILPTTKPTPKISRWQRSLSSRVHNSRYLVEVGPCFGFQDLNFSQMDLLPGKWKKITLK
jgi:hypothetical protein